MSQFRKLSGPTWVNTMLSRRLATVAAGVVLAVPAVLAGSGPATAASGSAPELVFTPSSYDYGQVAVGHAPPAAHDFTLTNRGTASSGPLTLTLSGPGSAAFAITNNRCDKIILRPGKSYTFTVQFVPTNSTAYIAGLTATSKRPGVTATLRLTGTGMVAGHLYWTNPRLNVAGAGTVVEAGLDGSNPQVIVSAQEGPFGVAVDNTHLYWANTENPLVFPGTIVEADLDGSNPRVIVSGQSDVEGMAVDSNHLFWSNFDTGTIVEADLDGNNAHVIVTGQDVPRGVAVDSTHLYWANFGGGTIVQANLNGSNPQVIATGQDGPSGVAVDSTHLYWANFDSGISAGTIVEADLDGSNPQVVATGQDGGGPAYVAVSDR